MNRDADRSDLAGRELAGVANAPRHYGAPFNCTELLCTMVDVRIIRNNWGGGVDKVLRHMKTSQVEKCLKALCGLVIMSSRAIDLLAWRMTSMAKTMSLCSNVLATKKHGELFNCFLPVNEPRRAFGYVFFCGLF